MTPQKKKIGVIYARYSSDAQNEQSIETQVEVCEKFARENDIIIIDKYIDKAKTGTNDRRPFFQKMVADSASGKFNCVVFYRMNRFARNQLDSLDYEDILLCNNVKCYSATEPINSDDPEDESNLWLKGILRIEAEAYSVRLKKRVKMGNKTSREKGHYTGGILPYGYEKNDDKTIRVNSEKANTIRTIFDMFLSGKTAKQIVAFLNAKNIVRDNGKAFTTVMIWDILKNEKYTGIYRIHDEVYDNIYPQIITKEIYEKSLHAFTIPIPAPSFTAKSEYLLSGKIYCGKCYTRMNGESGKNRVGEVYYYYKCRNAKKAKSTAKDNPCYSNAVPKDWIDQLVVNSTFEALHNNSIVEVIARGAAQLSEKKKKENNNLQVLYQTSQEKTRAINNLITAIENGLNVQSIKTRLELLERELAETKAKIATEELRSNTVYSEKEIQSFIYSFLKGDVKNDFLRRNIIKTFVRAVVVFEDKIIIIYNYKDKDGNDIFDIKKQTTEVLEMFDHSKQSSTKQNLNRTIG